MDLTFELKIPERWTVTKVGANYDIICPNGDKFDEGIGVLVGYLGIEIRYNGDVHYGKRKFKLIYNEDGANIASKLGIPKEWKVHKLEEGCDITRHNAGKFDEGLNYLAEDLGIEISLNEFVHSRKK